MYKDIVLKILDAIDYKHNKEEFADDFNRIISSQAIVALVKTLPAEKRDEADKAIASVGSQEEFITTVKKYFTEEQVQKSLDMAAAQAITEWIKAVQDTLNDDQRQKLVVLAVKLEEMMDAETKKK